MPTVNRLSLIEALKAQQGSTIEAIEALESALVRDAALEALLAKKGARIATFTFVTTPKMNKTKRGDRATKNPFVVDGVNVVRKRWSVNVLMAFDYEKKLAKKLAADGREDERQSHDSWHRPILNENGKPTALCHHKDDTDRVHVRLSVIRFLDSAMFDERDGTPIAPDAIADFLPPKNDNPIDFLTPSIDGIEELKINGQTFTVAA